MAWSLPWARKAATPAGPVLDADDAWAQHVSTLAAHGIPEPGSAVGGQPRSESLVSSVDSEAEPSGAASAATAVSRNSRSCQMTGDARPRPGISTLKRTLRSSLQVVGGSAPGA